MFWALGYPEYYFRAGRVSLADSGPPLPPHPPAVLSSTLRSNRSLYFFIIAVVSIHYCSQQSYWQRVSKELEIIFLGEKEIKHKINQQGRITNF